MNSETVKTFERQHNSVLIFGSLRTLDLSGILGDTISWLAERVVESEFDTEEGKFGGVEVVDLVLDCTVGTGIGERMNTDLQQLGVAVWNDVCVEPK